MTTEVNFSELNKLIELLSKERGVEKALITDAMIQGVLAAAKKKYGTYREIEAQYNEETGEIELYEFKEVIEDDKFVDEEIEIKMSEAKHLDPEVQVNDFLGTKLDMTGLGRIAVQTARQIMGKKVRDAEREIIFSEFENRKGEIASGIARHVERRNIVVDLGRTEAHIPPKDQIRGEVYKPGERIQGYILDVRQTTRGPQIVMSRSCNEYLIKLFEQEVPELLEGLVEIVSVAREPGQRAKVAVRSKDPDIDPVGSCVGMKGSRIQNVIQELGGEKIDVVLYDEGTVQSVCNALSPADITEVFLNEDERSMEVIVAENQLSLAIGKKGQNVRLAAKLTGWKLDIISEDEAKNRMAESIFNIMLIPGMTETMAQNFFQSGYPSFQELAKSSLDMITKVPGYEKQEDAKRIIEEAQKLCEYYKDKEIPTKFKKKTSEKVTDVHSEAERKLKEEMSKLESENQKSESRKSEKKGNKPEEKDSQQVTKIQEETTPQNPQTQVSQTINTQAVLEKKEETGEKKKN